MKKLLISTALISFLSLGGCGTTGSGGGPTVEDIIAQVQAAAVKICGFAPAGSVVANIIGSAVPGGGAIVAAAAIGQAICTAISPPKLARRGGPALVVKGWIVTPGAVNGVPVR
jgi:hypothetical protein